MANTRYRRGGAYAADMAVYARAMAADNSAQLSRVKRNLVRALREDVTPRQREVLLLYYAEQLNTRQIGEKLGVDKGTVARTIKRGEARHHQAGGGPAAPLPAVRRGGLSERGGGGTALIFLHPRSG